MKKLAFLAAGAVVLFASAAHAQYYYPGVDCRYPGPAYSNDQFSNECAYPAYTYPFNSYNAYYGDYPPAVVVQPAPVFPFPAPFFHRRVFIRRY